MKSITIYNILKQYSPQTDPLRLIYQVLFTQLYSLLSLSLSLSVIRYTLSLSRSLIYLYVTSLHTTSKTRVIYANAQPNEMEESSRAAKMSHHTSLQLVFIHITRVSCPGPCTYDLKQSLALFHDIRPPTAYHFALLNFESLNTNTIQQHLIYIKFCYTTDTVKN